MTDDRPATLRDLLGNPYLAAEDLRGRKVTLTIAAHPKREEMRDFETGEIVKKPVLRFERTPRSLILNRTNGECMAAMFGRDLAGWVGKKVTLFESVFSGKPCIRVWGSPELDKDTAVTIRLPGRRPVQMTLHKVERERAGDAKPAEAPAPSAKESA